MDWVYGSSLCFGFFQKDLMPCSPCIVTAAVSGCYGEIPMPLARTSGGTSACHAERHGRYFRPSLHGIYTGAGV